MSSLFWCFIMLLCTILNVYKGAYIFATLTGIVAILDFIAYITSK